MVAFPFGKFALQLWFPWCFSSGFDVKVRKVRVSLLNGAEVRFSSVELRLLLADWRLWVIVLAAYSLSATSSPLVFSDIQGYATRALFWVLSASLYVIVLERYVVAVMRAWSKVTSRPLPLILISAPLVLLVTHLSVWFVMNYVHDIATVNTWENLLMHLHNVLLVHGFETIALVWILPDIRRKRETRRTSIHGQVRARLPEPPARQILLAGRHFPLTDLKRVSAAEHHLNLHYSDRTEVVRERMRTFLKQMSANDGIQTHRSHWISNAEFDVFDGAGVTTCSGLVLPVARGRVEEVRAWVATHKPTTDVSLTE